MKIAILGGGGFRVPMVYGALLARAERLGLDEVALYDVDEERLAQIAPVLEGLEQERGERAAVPARPRGSTRRSRAPTSSSARSASASSRAASSTSRCRSHEGVVGQETTGPGGICFALRTVPVMRELAQAVARRAPQAWFVNFTNPAGLVTEAIQDILDGRVVGICDSPAGLFRRVAGALDRDPDELWFDYFGLNHLGWLRGVHDGERDLLPGPARRRRAAASRSRRAASSAPSGCARSG